VTYARGTEVNVAGSQQEVGRIFMRYGIETYSFGASPGKAVVEFLLGAFPVRVEVPLPPRPAEDKEQNPKTGRWVQTIPPWEQAVKERWRALVLLLKANLEAVELGLLSVEQAFMPYLILSDGRVLGDMVLPGIRSKLKELAQ
jgi:hypothetical protein